MYWSWENGIKEYLIMFLLKRGNDLNEELIIVTACFVKILSTLFKTAVAHFLLQGACMTTF